MSKHTPGPWTVHPMHGYEKQGWVEIWNSAHPVVTSDGFTRTRDGESEDHHGSRISPADAALIAAAPDLLAVAQLSLLRHADVEACPCGFCSVARAAIAKAGAK